MSNFTQKDRIARYKKERENLERQEAIAKSQDVSHDVKAEWAVLGSCLIDPDAYYKVSTHLTHRDFYVDGNGQVFRAMTNLANTGSPIDYVTVCSELGDHIKDIGYADTTGAAFITSLINRTPSAFGVEAYAKIVVDCSDERKLAVAASDIMATVSDKETELTTQEKVDMCQQILFAATEGRKTRSDPEISKDIVSRTFDLLEYRYQNKGKLLGVASGLTDIDELILGWQGPDVIYIGARPSMGKTGLMVNNFALNAAKLGVPTAVFSLEMSKEQLMMRAISSIANLDSHAIAKGEIEEAEWPIILNATSELANLPLHIDDTAGLPVQQLHAKARRMYMEHGIGLIVVDYLQLMQAGRQIDNRVQEISIITAGLKALAKELNIPIIVGSQLNRSVESRNDKRPMLSDLRESGTIEQDGDIVGFIYRDEYYNPDTLQKNVAELLIRKHRNGPVATIPLYFHKKTATFRNLEQETKSLNGYGYE